MDPFRFGRNQTVATFARTWTFRFGQIKRSTAGAGSYGAGSYRAPIVPPAGAGSYTNTFPFTLGACSCYEIGSLASSVSAFPPAALQRGSGDYFGERSRPEYALQGEYVGKVGSEGKTFGAQIIALGKGQFKAVAYPGGLPGEGADMSAEQIVSEGRMEGASVVFSNEVHTGRIADGRIVITANADNSVVGELQRIERVSATIDAKPPEGALVLFDGKSAAAFKGGRLTQDNLLDVGCETSEQFGDHHLHIEFRTPFMPLSRGQSRGNSGVYIQGRYELQVLDSFGLSGEKQ